MLKPCNCVTYSGVFTKNFKHVWTYTINFNTLWKPSLHVNMPQPSWVCLLQSLTADGLRSFLSAEPLRWVLFMPQNQGVWFFLDNTWRLPLIFNIVHFLTDWSCVDILFCPSCLKIILHAELGNPEVLAIKPMEIFSLFPHRARRKKWVMPGEGNAPIHGGSQQHETICVYPDRACGQGSQASQA